MGALVYFLIFSQGPSPGPRDVVQSQPTVQPTLTGKDGAPMVLIPTGEFMMGSQKDDKMASEDEQPVHPVYLDAFYIDQYEVTTSRYATFFHETKQAAPRYWSDRKSTRLNSSHG